MIKTGDIVTISPVYSLKFGGRKGKVVKIVPKDGLYLKIKFKDEKQTYGFTEEEVLKEEK
ncbi:MAG: hypothetical protein E7205_02325 [Tissierellaceae bacterium]|nr:hypothetical protein [Tissierellaceae bacterium]